MTRNTDLLNSLLGEISADRPVLIAGPTASGKSALALAIAQAQGGTIINADAIQVFDDWRILTARPSAEDEARAPHALYGHVSGKTEYSVGHWLRDLDPYLTGPSRPIIVGGTGLYFTALTQGLADIPRTPDAIRAQSSAIWREQGLDPLIRDLDDSTRARIDLQNPARVCRAWEVWRSTGKQIATWQDETPPPRLSLEKCHSFLFDAPKDWLTPRIEGRFHKMVEQGALEEAQANAPDWDPAQPSAKAIGAAELIAHVTGTLPLRDACDRATILTRQFAKRQRTWFRARMSGWQSIPGPEVS